MIIEFQLNGKEVSIDTAPEKRLADILREIFGLLQTKTGCYSGECGACTVLFNGDIVQSCMLPAFYIKNSSIITIEGFSQTAEYADIKSGFERAGCFPCGYCHAGKILAVHALLDEHPTPDDITILAGLSGNKCICTDYSSLINGVKNAAQNRKKIRGERKK